MTLGVLVVLLALGLGDLVGVGLAVGVGLTVGVALGVGVVRRVGVGRGVGVVLAVGVSVGDGRVAVGDGEVDGATDRWLADGEGEGDGDRLPDAGVPLGPEAALVASLVAALDGEATDDDGKGAGFGCLTPDAGTWATLRAATAPWSADPLPGVVDWLGVLSAEADVESEGVGAGLVWLADGLGAGGGAGSLTGPHDWLVPVLAAPVAADTM